MSPLSNNEQDTQSHPTAGRKRIGIIVTFALILALLGLLAWGLRKVQAGPRDSGMAPDFTITSFDGRTVTLSELQGHRQFLGVLVSSLPRRGGVLGTNMAQV
jgi:hypothetical protein